MLTKTRIVGVGDGEKGAIANHTTTADLLCAAVKSSGAIMCVAVAVCKTGPATNPKQTKETCLSWSPWRMEQKPAEEWIYAGTPVVVCRSRFLNWDARLRIGPHQLSIGSKLMRPASIQFLSRSVLISSPIILNFLGVVSHIRWKSVGSTQQIGEIPQIIEILRANPPNVGLPGAE